MLDDDDMMTMMSVWRAKETENKSPHKNRESAKFASSLLGFSVVAPSIYDLFVITYRAIRDCACVFRYACVPAQKVHRTLCSI